VRERTPGLMIVFCFVGCRSLSKKQQKFVKKFFEKSKLDIYFCPFLKKQKNFCEKRVL